jgi:hypothetical protein
MADDLGWEPMNMMANWVMAAVHSRWAFFQSLLTRRKTRYSSLIAASSVGKCPRLRTAVRSVLLRLSMALVV